jgi:hypothetical protein
VCSLFAVTYFIAAKEEDVKAEAKVADANDDESSSDSDDEMPDLEVWVFVVLRLR